MNYPELDQAIVLDGLSLRSLIILIERLGQSETPEQFICREMELDDAYRHADMDLRLATEESLSDDYISELGRVRRHVLAAHDYLGESKVAEAVEQLNRIVEMKIGLDGQEQ